MNNIQAKDITTRLASRADEVAAYLLPSGRLDGNEWRSGDVSGASGQSLGIHLSGDKAGVWQDFATGEGGDLLTLWQAVRGCNFKQALNEAAEYLGMDTTPARPKLKAKPLPVRTSPPDGVDGVSRFTYTDADKRPVIYVTRKDTTDGKSIRQWGHSPDGKGWIASLDNAPKPRPLYRLSAILKGGGIVCIHEGEKAVVAAAKARLQGIHTTSIGGAGNAKHSDFTPLKGHDVCIIPDNDEPGEKHAEQVAKLATEAGAKSVKIVHLPGLPPKGDCVEWLASGGTPEAWQKLLDEAKVYVPEIPKRKVTAISIADLLSMEIPTRETIIDPWLPDQGLGMIYGYRGTGKTHVSLGLGVAVASGGRFLQWEAPAPKGVLFIDGEMPARTLQERLADIIAKAEKEPAAPLRIITPDLQDFGMPNLSDFEGQKNIEPYLDGISLIILDNISTLCRGGRENDAESWIPVQEWALRMRARGFSILFIHHSGKGGQQRGTSKREDVLDTVISLKRPADYTPDQGACFEVHYEKARGCYGDEVKPFEAMLTPDGWTMKDLEQSMTEKVATLLNDSIPQAEIHDMLGVTKGCVSKHKKKAAALGLILKAAA